MIDFCNILILLVIGFITQIQSDKCFQQTTINDFCIQFRKNHSAHFRHTEIKKNSNSFNFNWWSLVFPGYSYRFRIKHYSYSQDIFLIAHLSWLKVSLNMWELLKQRIDVFQTRGLLSALMARDSINFPLIMDTLNPMMRGAWVWCLVQQSLWWKSLKTSACHMDKVTSTVLFSAKNARHTAEEAPNCQPMSVVYSHQLLYTIGTSILKTTDLSTRQSLMGGLYFTHPIKIWEIILVGDRQIATSIIYTILHSGRWFRKVGWVPTM